MHYVIGKFNKAEVIELSIIVKAKVIKETFRNGDYRIISWMPMQTYEDIQLSPYMSFSTKGETPFINTDGNKEYELELELIKHDAKWGDSFRIIDVPSMRLEELNDENELKILKEITTESQANYIHDAYPNFIRLILNGEEDKIDLNKIYNVAEYRFNAYKREINTKYKYFGLVQNLKEYRVDISDCKKLYDKYEEEFKIQRAIKENPYYVLTEVLERSFNKSDKLILDLFPDLIDSRIRCEALMLDILKRNEADSNTRLNGNFLWQICKEDYNAPDEWAYVIKDIAKNSDLIYYDEKSKDLSIMNTYIGESLISNFIKNKLANSNELDIDWNNYKIVDGFELTNDQLKALENACRYNFSLLIGYSGTGKTSSLKGLITMLEDNRLTYTLLAPTGAASMRITEQTNRPSSTIHRKCLKDGEIWSDFIIVDETSMVDLDTMIMLINCIQNDEARIILCGDNAQLLPVGKGNVFNDIISCDYVPRTMLTQVFRYDTNGALFVATNIREGKSFFNNTEKVKVKDNVYSVENNYKFIQTDEDKIFDELRIQYDNLLNKGIKPKDIMILCPFNIGSCGNYKINNEIQAEVNAPKPNEKIFSREVNGINIIFREDSRVINKKNDYNALPLESYELIQNDETGLLKEEDIEHTQIFNGQKGIVRSVDDKKMVVQFDEELVVFDKIKVNNLLLSYSQSTHSSQGSESKYVISIVNPIHKRMLNRNLLYVADTRAKILHIDIGDINTFNDALLIDGNELRNTWLKDLLLDNSN